MTNQNLQKMHDEKKFLIKFELDNGEFYEEYIDSNLFERISFLQKQLHQPKALADIKFIYCPVGNIIKRYDRAQDKIVKGTKHFSAGTKVYCYPPSWGDGYENIKVIGRHRKSPRLVTMVLPSKCIINWRLKTVYEPFVIKEMTEHFGWINKESDKERINEMLVWLTKK